MTEPEAPAVGPDDAFFWDGVARGELLVQRCADCRAVRHPPRPMCPRCGALHWDALRCTGDGTILCAVLPRHPPLPTERIVVLVALDEGVRFVTNLAGAPLAAARPGVRVRVGVEPVADGLALPQARLTAGHTSG